MLIYTVLYYNVLDCLILQSTILNRTILYCTIPCYTLLVLYPTCTILVLLDTDQRSRHLLLRPPPFRKPKTQHPAADNRMIQNCTIHTRTRIKHVKHSSPTRMHRGLTAQHTIHRTHMVFFSCNKNGRTCKLNQAITQHWAHEDSGLLQHIIRKTSLQDMHHPLRPAKFLARPVRPGRLSP